jgi:ABC-type Fe3+-hydroxamate transport system substrate-binding protein
VVLTQDICSVCAVDLKEVESALAGCTESADGSARPPPRIVSLNPGNLDDILRDCVVVGDAVGLPAEGARLQQRLQDRIDAATAVARHEEFVQRLAGLPPQTVAFVEWPDPLFVGGHWTPQLIEMAGGVHRCACCAVSTRAPAPAAAPAPPPLMLPVRALPPSHRARPPSHRPPAVPPHSLNLPKAEHGGGAGKSFPVTPEAFVASDPDVIIVSPCGLDLGSCTREAELLMQQPWFAGMRAVREGRLVTVDGDAMFNR